LACTRDAQELYKSVIASLRQAWPTAQKLSRRFQAGCQGIPVLAGPAGAAIGTGRYGPGRRKDHSPETLLALATRFTPAVTQVGRVPWSYVHLIGGTETYDGKTLATRV
jgi:hypothetical protein